jgi:probable rRNA maturation factor
MPIWIRRAAPQAPPLSKIAVRRMALSMLGELGLESSELSILLTDDSRIRTINRDHRHKDKPTDVLSFPQLEFRAPLKPRGALPLTLLGDIVISLDTAERQATSRRRPLENEVRFLLAHGILHLLGYDHATPTEKKEMTKQTRRLVRASATR